MGLLPILRYDNGAKFLEPLSGRPEASLDRSEKPCWCCQAWFPPAASLAISPMPIRRFPVHVSPTPVKALLHHLPGAREHF